MKRSLLYPVGLLTVYLLVFVGIGGSQVWIQNTKAHFRTGTLNGVQATIPPGEDDGYITLARTVYNGFFNESDDSLDGWIPENQGDGPHTIEVVDAAGRTSVLHLYASYGTQITRTRVYQVLKDGLDFLTRFNIELYPISSEISGNGGIAMHVFVYDSAGNDLINGWFTFVLDGPLGGNYQWQNQTVRDRWNIYRFDLKAYIERHLSGHAWSDVAQVKIMLTAEGNHPGESYGAYIDAIWAAPFIDDNFNDNLINTSKWKEYENLYHVDEQNQVVRFWGYDNSNTLWSSLDREGDTVHTASCEASALIRTQYMENEDGQGFSLGFYSPVSGKMLILFGKALPDYHLGYYEVEYYDGSSWNSTTLGTYYFLNMANFYTWRIFYDADNQRFEAWVDGKMVGRVENFPMTEYYPYLAAVDNDNDPLDSIDCQVDNFMFFDFSQGNWDTRYVPYGEYISAPYDFGFEADFRRLRWVGSTPPGTDIKFQFRSGETLTELQNSPWFGPTGINTYYTTSGQNIYEFHDGHRWFQVKAILSSTDSLVTPTLDSIIVEFDSMAVIQGDSALTTIPVGQGVTSVVHYDGNGNRSLVAHFTNPVGSQGDPQFLSAVHNQAPMGIDRPINRWWRLDFTGSFDAVDLTFFYLNSDLPQGFPEDSLHIWHYMGNPPAWADSLPDLLDTLNNFASINNITQLSKWSLGLPAPTHVSESTVDRTYPVLGLNGGKEITVVFSSKAMGYTNISIFDVTGRAIFNATRLIPQSGERVITFRNPVYGKPGIYFFYLKTGRKKLIKKFIQLR